MSPLFLHFLPLVFTGLFGLPVGENDQAIKSVPTSIHTIPIPEENPLLRDWIGPYGGVPPLDIVRVEHFEPALKTAMLERLGTIKRIASNPSPPNFDNTIVALERSGQAMERVQKIYGIWNVNMVTPEFEAMKERVGTSLTEFQQTLLQNEKLFKRVEAIGQSADKMKLTSEQRRLVWLYQSNLRHASAQLNADQRARYTQFNRDLEGLFSRFNENLRADEQKVNLLLEREDDLAGLPTSVRNAFADQARKRDLADKWVVTNTRSAVDQFLTYSTNRSLRERVWRTFSDRGKAKEVDNRGVIADILRLRQERARLLGYSSHTHWRMENSMARTPENVMNFLKAAFGPALETHKREVSEMQMIARSEGLKATLQPWDYLYYGAKVKQNRNDPEPAEVKPYLQLHKLREGMFWIAGQVYNFSFSPASGVPVNHPDIEVWEVRDKTSGKHVGLWYYDPYPREGKGPGARIFVYRVQENIDKAVTPLTANSTNFPKGEDGEPVLLTWENAMSLYHEFGHALHALSSNVTYPSLSGILVPRDYVEFPSHLMQHWLATPEVLQRFAVHYRTGKPMPAELAARILAASKYGQGTSTMEYLINAWMDMKYHLAEPGDISSNGFERQALASLGVPADLAERFNSATLSTIFGSDTNSGGYYSSVWMAALIADAFSAFTEVGNAYDQDVAAKWRKHVFSAGNSIDPADGYRAFRGRDLTVDALLQKRGLVGN